MKTSPFAGTPPEVSDLIDIPQLIRAYDTQQPDPTVTAQQVRFGTSGHRGCSLDSSFNRNHIWAITQAICWYRKKHDMTGPLFLGIDTHALSVPAFQSSLEVLAANDVTVLIAPNDEFTPTPVISHAILNYNRGRKQGFADGIVVSPSHNPPREGGFKYNPSHGGPAEKRITDWIQNQANEFLKTNLREVRKIPFPRARNAATTQPYDFLNPYVRDLGAVLDMDIIRSSAIRLGVDPMGGAGVHYWPVIRDLYQLNLEIINSTIDPTFRFVPRDWDGQIRMDPSSPFAMGGLTKKSDDYDIAFACDTDHDRHGIVTPEEGLMPSNDYLAVATDYLFKNRPLWPTNLKIGKTVVSSKMIDRVASTLKREVYEVPVGFKWFVEGFHSGSLGFAGEESAGATFLRKPGQVWTTDKDGIVPALLAAEMTARSGKTPTVLYRDLCQVLGDPLYRREEAPAGVRLRAKLQNISATDFSLNTLAGEKVTSILTKAPGNGESIGGVKVETKSGWFAARPSGTEDIYKIYAESFMDQQHLNSILREAQAFVDEILNSDETDHS